MANANIDNLSAAVSLNGIELVEIMQGGINKKTTTQDIADLGGGATPTLDEVLAEGATLTEDRTVDLNGFILQFQQGGENFLYINPTVDDEAVYIKANNNTDDGNNARVRVAANIEESEFELSASFNGGVKEAEISALADATTATIAYTADTHTFTGNIISATLLAASFADDAAAAAGGIAVGGLYRTAGAVKIRLS